MPAPVHTGTIPHAFLRKMACGKLIVAICDKSLRAGQGKTNVAGVERLLGMSQKQLVFQPLMVELLLVHPVPIVILAMTGGAQTEQIRCKIADIVVLVRCV